MKRLRDIFREKIILSFIMCVLMCVVLVSATYGWYAINNSTKAHGLDLKLAEMGENVGIKVAVAPGGPDIMSEAYTDVHGTQTLPADGGETYANIEGNLKKFTNIDVNKALLAPGAYGELNFYITALGENVKNYSLYMSMEYKTKLPEGLADDKKQELEQQISQIMADHITVYQTKTTAADGTVRFADPISFYTILDPDTGRPKDGTPMKGELEHNREVTATLYWVWNYELTDIPGYESKTELGRFFTGTDRTSDEAKRSAVRLYDEEDTLLGNYLDKIRFYVYVEGNGGPNTGNEGGSNG